MPLLAPEYSTRRWLTVGTIVAGAVAGAIFGLVLTRLGKILGGAPPATLANYAWNAMVFGIVAAVVSPLITWSSLRRAPLWRTVMEPLAYAIAGGCIAVIVGVGALILILPPVGLVLGFVRLAHKYPEKRALPPSGDHGPALTP